MEKPGNSICPSVYLRTTPPLFTLIIMQGKLTGHELELTATFLLFHLVITELKVLHIFLGGFCLFPLSSHSDQGRSGHSRVSQELRSDKLSA